MLLVYKREQISWVLWWWSAWFVFSETYEKGVRLESWNLNAHIQNTLRVMRVSISGIHSLNTAATLAREQPRLKIVHLLYASGNTTLCLVLCYNTTKPRNRTNSTASSSKRVSTSVNLTRQKGGFVNWYPCSKFQVFILLVFARISFHGVSFQIPHGLSITYNVLIWASPDVCVVGYNFLV